MADPAPSADREASGLRLELSQTAPIPLDVALSVAAGELLALVGPSGSGKTSILRAIAGLLRPASGRIVCAGHVWFDSAQAIWRPPQQRTAGLVFQDYALFPHYTVQENVEVPLRHLGQDARRSRALDLLQRVNLDGLEGRLPHQLSGGQRQRVALARALAREPGVLLLDEPFAAVDQMTRERLKRELAQMKSRLGVPTILVTHDLDEALALGDRMAVLHHGRLLQVGAPDEVRLCPVSPLVARLLGETNIFQGTVRRESTSSGSGRLAWAGHALEVADTGGVPAGTRVDWLIPTGQIVMHRRDRPSAGERENPINGQVVELVRLGDDTSVVMAVAGSEEVRLRFRVSTHVANRNALVVGAEIAVSLLAEAIHLMSSDRDGRGQA